MMTGNTKGAQDAVGSITSGSTGSRGHGEQRQVDDVLHGIGDRPLRDQLHFLQLAGGHEAPGEGQEAEDDLHDDRDHAEGREILRTLPEPQVVLGGADQPGREATEGMRQGGPLRDGRERHRDSGTPTRMPATRATTIQP